MASRFFIKAAGADHAGLEEYIKKIKSGWTDIDDFQINYVCYAGVVNINK